MDLQQRDRGFTLRAPPGVTQGATNDSIMLLDAISQSLPMSIGVALSPLPIAAVLIILMTSRARTNAPAFLLGWIAGILAIGVAVFTAPGLLTARGEPTQLSGVIRILLGLALLLLSARQWARRPAPGAAIETPPILARLDSIGALRSLITGFLFSAIHPKNLILNAAGAAAIEACGIDRGTQYTALLLFSLIASTSIVVPIGVYFVARRKASAVLGRCRDWQTVPGHCS